MSNLTSNATDSNRKPRATSKTRTAWTVAEWARNPEKCLAAFLKARATGETVGVVEKAGCGLAARYVPTSDTHPWANVMDDSQRYRTPMDAYKQESGYPLFCLAIPAEVVAMRWSDATDGHYVRDGFDGWKNADEQAIGFSAYLTSNEARAFYHSGQMVACDVPEPTGTDPEAPEAPIDLPPISGGSPAVDSFRLAYAPPADPINALPWRVRPIARFIRKPTWTWQEVRKMDRFAQKLNDGFGSLECDDDEDDLGLAALVELQQMMDEFGALAKRGHQGFPTAPNIANVHELAPVKKSKPVKSKGPRMTTMARIMMLVEAARGAASGHEGSTIRAMLASFTPAQRAAVSKKCDEYRPSTPGRTRGSLEVFLYGCVVGSPVSFPEPTPIPAPEATAARAELAQAYREERATGERHGFPVTAGSVGGGFPLKGCPGPQRQSIIPRAMTREELRAAGGLPTTAPVLPEATTGTPEASSDTPTPRGWDAIEADDVPPARDFVHLVYDVIQHVKPGTMASYPAGSWLDASFSSLKQAREYAARCNLYRLVDGLEYEVACTHDEATDRRQSIADWKREQAVTPAEGVPGFSGDVPPISGGSPEAYFIASPAADAETTQGVAGEPDTYFDASPTDSALAGLARLARVNPAYPDGEFDPTGAHHRAEMRAVEAVIRGEIMALIVRQREGDRGPDGLDCCHWEAGLVWHHMDRTEREDFGRWMDHIGYHPGLAQYGPRGPEAGDEERWNIFFEECLVGCELPRPDPTDPEGDDDGQDDRDDVRFHGRPRQDQGRADGQQVRRAGGRDGGLDGREPAVLDGMREAPADGQGGAALSGGDDLGQLSPPPVEWSDMLGRYVIDWDRWDQATSTYPSAGNLGLTDTPSVGNPQFSPDDPYVTIAIDGRAYGVTFREDCLMLDKADGATYEIVVGDLGLECSCPSWRHRCKGLHGANCKHTAAVLASGYDVPAREAVSL